MSTKATFAVMMALCAASACDDSSAPVLGRRVIAVDGSGQVGTVGELVSLPYQVLVTEVLGMVLPGHPVSWTVLSGGGSMHAADDVTDANGYASATHRLGTTAGIHTVRVTASGAETPVWFHTIAEPAAPATVTKFSGDGQTGAPGQALAAPYRVRVTDQYDNPNVGVRVEWVALRGSLSTATEEYTSTEGVARAWHVLSNEAGVPDSVLAVVDSAGARDTIVFVSHATSTLQILT